MGGSQVITAGAAMSTAGAGHRNQTLRLAPTTDVARMASNGGKYDTVLDPLWNDECGQDADPFGKDEIAFYQSDLLGTPQVLTACEGKVAWSAQYKAWGVSEGGDQ